MTYFTKISKMSHRNFPVFLTQRLRFILLSQGKEVPRLQNWKLCPTRGCLRNKKGASCKKQHHPQSRNFGNINPIKMDLTFQNFLEVGEVLHLDLVYHVFFGKSGWHILFHCCHQEDQHGHTPLLWAVRHGMAGAMQLLLRRMQV